VGKKISDTKRNIVERITDYFSFFLKAIKDNAWIRNEEKISFREIGEREGYVRGHLYLHGGHELHVAEYVVINQGKPVAIKYRYQLQTPDNKSIVRWDNAPHHRNINSFPQHKHCRDGSIIASSINNLFEILNSLDSELKIDGV
jgi:hypothetical protein